VVQKAKYLGMWIDLNAKKQRCICRSQIDRNISGFAGRLTLVNTVVKESLVTAFATWLLQYFATTMRAAGVWSEEQVRSLERRILRRAHCIPNYVKKGRHCTTWWRTRR